MCPHLARHPRRQRHHRRLPHHAPHDEPGIGHHLRGHPRHPHPDHRPAPHRHSRLLSRICPRQGWAATAYSGAMHTLSRPIRLLACTMAFALASSIQAQPPAAPIVAVGSSVEHPQGARVIDLGDATLLPGLIDAHVHLFLHPGAEDLQTVEESVPWRTLLAAQAAKADLMAGFTAERDMGTEGAGSADTAVRDAINAGFIPGPRLRISGNAITILGGHEDAIRYNPAQHVLPNADYANSSDQLVEIIRAQHKEGSDFVKIYENGQIGR